jgi:undecaprenyl-diphosphatase
MTCVSNPFVWVPMYVALVYVLISNYSYRSVLMCALAVCVLILITDAFSSNVIRPFVGRLRPSNLNNPLSDVVHIVDGHRGGRFGFPSAHSGNAWAVAFFVAYLFRKRVLTWFLCAWALLVCYSRLYLGVHYPGDLLGGLVLAFVGATLVYWVFTKVSREEPKPELRHVYIPIIVGMLTIMILFVVSLCR